MKRLTFREKAQRINLILRDRGMDGPWHQVVELLADIIHWSEVEALACINLKMDDALPEPSVFDRLLKEARLSRDRHHCIYCHDETEEPLLATVCEGHAHLVKEK